MRLVKLAVDYDDPAVYHIHYGEGTGRPGSLPTFFAWPGAPGGRLGTGMASDVALGIPSGAAGYRDGRRGRGGSASRGRVDPRGEHPPRRPARPGRRRTAVLARQDRPRGVPVAPVEDGTYFRSICFREPGGVLREIATDGPGFAVDEAVHRLGSDLKLPESLASPRERLERRLPALWLPRAA